MTEYSEQDVDNNVVLQGDVQFTFCKDEGLSAEPQTGDKIIFGGETFSILNPRRIAPNGVVLCYKLQGRK